MFNLKDFVMNCIHGMAKTEPEYKVRQYALGWYDKGVLAEEDLATIDGWLQEPSVAPVQEETE